MVDTIRRWHQGTDGEEMQVRWEQVPQQENDEDCGVATVMTMVKCSGFEAHENSIPIADTLT